MLKIATIEDLPELKRMSLLFKEHSPYKNHKIDETKIEEVILGLLSEDPKNAVILLSYIDTKIVGMVVGIAREFMFSKERHATELVWWVDPEYRGSAGKELFGAFSYWAKKVGCKYLHMTLLQNEELTKMKKLYKTLGFKPLEQAWVRELP